MPMEAPALNPTGGVIAKQPVGLDYKKDPTRPGGGVFIANRSARGREEDFRDVAPGTIISGASSDEGSEGEAAPPRAAISSAPANHNDLERTYSLSSSSFAPPLPRDRSYSGSTYARGMLTPVSAVRSPVGNEVTQPQQQQQQQQHGSGRSLGQRREEQGQGPSGSSLVNFTPLNSGRGGYGNVNPALNMPGQSGLGNVQLMNVLDGPQGDTTLAEFAMADTGFLEGIPGGMFDWGEYISHTCVHGP